MSADYCPTCHSIIDTETPISWHGLHLFGPNLRYGSATIKLTPSEATILRHLMRRGSCSKEALLMQMSEKAQDDDHTLRVVLHKLRRKLKGSGTEIQNDWGWGYRLEAA